MAEVDGGVAEETGVGGEALKLAVGEAEGPPLHRVHSPLPHQPKGLLPSSFYLQFKINIY